MIACWLPSHTASTRSPAGHGAECAPTTHLVVQLRDGQFDEGRPRTVQILPQDKCSHAGVPGYVGVTDYVGVPDYDVLGYVGVTGYVGVPGYVGCGSIRKLEMLGNNVIYIT